VFGLTKRVRLQFDRNKDIRTEYYYVYRSIEPSIHRHTPRIMKIKQIPFPNPVFAQDTAKRIDERTYQFSHRGIFEDRPYAIYVNGEIASPSTYTLYGEEGVIRFMEDREESDIVTAEYYFDGIEVVDDFTGNEHLQVEYYGPPAEDIAAPSAPTNLQMTVRSSEGEVELSYSIPENEGQTFYYSIEARNDKGDYSLLSPLISVHLKEDIAQVLIEASTDGIAWSLIGTSSDTYYIDTHGDTEPPEPLSQATVFSSPANQGKAIVTFTWETPLKNEKISFSPRYRVRTQLANGVISEASQPIGPELIRSNLEKIVILAKANTDVFPTYNDPTATTVAEITDYNSGQYSYEAIAGRKYNYSLFVVDKSGNYSIATTLSITV
jgi:hypothetical protein